MILESINFTYTFSTDISTNNLKQTKSNQLTSILNNNAYLEINIIKIANT